MQNYVMPFRQRLRWGFDFVGKPSRRGIWLAHIPGVLNGEAWNIDKSGMCRALIEGEDVLTNKTKVLCDCENSDFINFEWIKADRMRFGALKNSNSVKLSGRLIGLRMVTNDLFVDVFVDGSDPKVSPRPESHKRLNLAAHAY